jgi:dihydroxyacetone kinase-like protein
MVLDQSIGDGDHVFNLIRGLEALRGIRGDIECSTSARAEARREQGAEHGRRLVGTAVLVAAPRHVASVRSTERRSARLRADVRGGVKAVQDRGKTGKGSKTMMDVLIPVAERFSELADREPSVPLILAELPKEAARGMLATRDMLATKGRASFLGERSLGHIDPGARSSEIMITAVCERIGKGATS